MKRLSLVTVVFVAASFSPIVAYAEEGQSPPPSSTPTAPSAPPLAPTPASPPAAVPNLAPAPLPAVPEAGAATRKESAETLTAFRAWVTPRAEPERAYRWIGAVSELAVGGTLLPAGAVLYSREGSAVTGALIGLGVAGLVGGLRTVVFGSDFDAHDRAESAMEHERALGHDDAAVLAAGENELRHAADSQRLERLVGGGIGAGLGVAALGWGAAFAAADFTSSSFTRRQQDGVSVALLLGGAICTVTSLQALLLPSTAEVSWQGYSQTKRAKSVAAFAPSEVAFHATPLPGGGASAGISGKF